MMPPSRLSLDRDRQPAGPSLHASLKSAQGLRGARGQGQRHIIPNTVMGDSACQTAEFKW
ncbi:hypothetical protein NBRC3299_0279 [Acetobacter pasteurianus NBRC 3299]|nr:hypothetical protein NBRC3299_0279 [Acetobacter pasteurianus NBRC 3299]